MMVLKSNIGERRILVGSRDHGMTKPSHLA